MDFSDFLPTLCEAARILPPKELMVDGRSILPQLMGQAGQPREWIYGWYARDGRTNAKEWVRDKKYKLYLSGELYDVTVDFMRRILWI